VGVLSPKNDRNLNEDVEKHFTFKLTPVTSGEVELGIKLASLFKLWLGKIIKKGRSSIIP